MSNPFSKPNFCADKNVNFFVFKLIGSILLLKISVSTKTLSNLMQLD